MSDRDDLAALIWGDGDWEAAKRMHDRPYVKYPEVGRVLNAVDRLIASGFRRVGEDEVVVRRSDLEVMLDIALRHRITAEWKTSGHQQVHDRLSNALSAEGDSE